jgi:DNA-binding FrmR family transcriptional regulator
LKYDEDVLRRLKRIEGQIRGVMRMMEEDKDCKEVAAQLSAIRNATDKALTYIVAMNLEQCIVDEVREGKDSKKLVHEAVELLMKSR